MAEWAPIGISLVALLVSLYVLWSNEIRAGSVTLVRPTQIYIGGKQPIPGMPQVIFISMLAWSSKKGGRLENLAAIVHHGDDKWEFPIWVISNESGNMHRGHPMYVSKQGSRAEIHFVRAKDASLVHFQSGSVRIEILCSANGRRTSLLDFESAITIDQADLINQGGGVFFDRVLTTDEYVASDDRRGVDRTALDDLLNITS